MCALRLISALALNPNIDFTNDIFAAAGMERFEHELYQRFRLGPMNAQPVDTEWQSTSVEVVSGSSSRGSK